MADQFYWDGMKDSNQHGTKCVICQKNKAFSLAQDGILQQLNLPQRTREVMSLDFMKEPHKAQAFDVYYPRIVTLSPLSSHFMQGGK